MLLKCEAKWFHYYFQINRWNLGGKFIHGSKEWYEANVCAYILLFNQKSIGVNVIWFKKIYVLFSELWIHMYLGTDSILFCLIFSANSIYSDYLLIALKSKEKKKLFPNQSTNTNKSHLKQLYHHLLTTSTDSFVTHKKNFFRHVFQILFHFCANKFFPHTYQPNTQLTQLKVHFHYMTC